MGSRREPKAPLRSNNQPLVWPRDTKVAPISNGSRLVGSTCLHDITDWLSLFAGSNFTAPIGPWLLGRGCSSLCVRWGPKAARALRGHASLSRASPDRGSVHPYDDPLRFLPIRSYLPATGRSGEIDVDGNDHRRPYRRHHIGPDGPDPSCEEETGGVGLVRRSAVGRGQPVACGLKADAQRPRPLSSRRLSSRRRRTHGNHPG